MNNGSLWRGILIALLVVSAAAAIGVGAYNAGVAHGIADSGRALAAVPDAGVHGDGWHRHGGFGVFPVFPFFFVLFMFLMMRALWWGGPGWYGHRGWGRGYGYGAPPDRRQDEADPRR